MTCKCPNRPKCPNRDSDGMAARKRPEVAQSLCGNLSECPNGVRTAEFGRCHEVRVAMSELSGVSFRHRTFGQRTGHPEYPNGED